MRLYLFVSKKCGRFYKSNTCVNNIATLNVGQPFPTHLSGAALQKLLFGK